MPKIARTMRKEKQKATAKKRENRKENTMDRRIINMAKERKDEVKVERKEKEKAKEVSKARMITKVKESRITKERKARKEKVNGTIKEKDTPRKEIGAPKERRAERPRIARG